MQKEHQYEIDIITMKKDRELQSNQKIINDLQNKLNQKKDNSIKRDPKFSEKMIELENKNKYLQNENERMNVYLKNRDNIIEKLNKKINFLTNDYNRKINSLRTNNTHNQPHIDQLQRERDQLLQQNTELTTGINQLNEKVKDTFMMFNEKKNEFKKVIQNYKEKLKEYKTKIVTLKRKIDELHIMNNNNNTSYYIGHKDHSAILDNNRNNKILNKSFRKKNNVNLFTDDFFDNTYRKKSLDIYKKKVEHLGTK